MSIFHLIYSLDTFHNVQYVLGASLTAFLVKNENSFLTHALTASLAVTFNACVQTAAGAHIHVATKNTENASNHALTANQVQAAILLPVHSAFIASLYAM